MTRRFLRVLFGPIGRALLVLLVVGAGWGVWWLLPDWPLRTMDTTFSGQWKRQTGTAGCERVVYWVDGQAEGSGVRLVCVDLRAGRVHDVESSEIIWNWRASSDLSWVAWEVADRCVQVAILPEIENSFKIPALAEVVKGIQTTVSSSGRGLFYTYHLVASPDHQRLALIVRGGSVFEVWDVPTRRKLCRVENGEVGPQLSAHLLSRRGVPQFSVDGSLLGMDAGDNFDVVFWDVATGRRVGALPAERYSANFFAPCPDGRVLAGYVGNEVNDTVIKFCWPSKLQWDSDSTITIANWSQFFPKQTRWAADGSVVAFSSVGKKNNDRVTTLWDVRAQPPRCIEDAIGISGSTATFDTQNRRFVIGDRQAVHLFNKNTLAKVPLQDSGPFDGTAELGFSPDGQWLLVADNGTVPPSTSWHSALREFGRRLVGRDERTRINIYKAETGALINRIPGDSVCSWPADGHHVWVQRSATVSGNKNSHQIRFELYSVDRAGAAIWLWIVTIAGVVILVCQLRRRWLGQPRAANK